jgi:hypothetical protein
VIGIGELAGAVRRALALVSARPGVIEVEAFASANTSLLARLCYTSHIPCNGVEEPKSSASHGLGLQVVFEGPDGPRIGFGSEPGDLGDGGIERAFVKARQGAVHDPEFVSLPRPTGEARGLVDYHDPRLMALADDDLVDAGWRVTEGALRTFLGSSRLAGLARSDRDLRALGVVLGGDVAILQERMAIVSTAMPDVQTDESTLMTAAVTGMIEAREAKGSGWAAASRLDEFTDEAGIDAARNALEAIDGVRIPSGTCTVVFGPQAVADLVSNIIVPACQAPSFHASSTPFLGKLGRRVAWPGLTISDQGARPGLVGSKGITCEGLPTGRTDLIRDGVLVGCLASWYEAQRLLRDPALGEKLGAAGDLAAAALAPRNGFRFGDGGGRNFDTTPGASASNVVIESAATVSPAELLRRVGDGLYVGRIWYTYVINGLRAGDFTCTVVADSYLIRDGRLAAPLRPNTVRISDNIMRVLDSIVGVGGAPRATPVWAADEVVHAPELAVRDVPVDAIAGFVDELQYGGASTAPP